MKPQLYSPNLREILVAASKHRQRFSSPNEPFDVVRALEHVIEDGVVLDIIDGPIRGPAGTDQQALLDCATGLLLVREDVYVGASKGNPADRFTLAHEIGHVRLHYSNASNAAKLARGRPGSGTSFASNPQQEREANEFGGALLLPPQAIDPNTTIEEAMRYVISRPAAEATLRRTRVAFPDKWRLGA